MQIECKDNVKKMLDTAETMYRQCRDMQSQCKKIAKTIQREFGEDAKTM